MGRHSRFEILLLMLGVMLVTSPVRTTAQCFGALPGLGPINGMTGNPFQAEVKHTFFTQNTSLVQDIEPKTEYVARDSQGRLRTDWSAGKYKVQNGPGAGTEVEQHHVTICDPVKGLWISLDTLNKTATIQKTNIANTSPKALPAGVSLPNFCSRQFQVPPNFANTEPENLGHRTIEGMGAEGVLERRTVQLRNGRSGDATAVAREMISVTETWCSEELGAVILRVIGTEKSGNTQTIAMVNIQRGEPDESLFQIPPDYRVAERVNNPAARTGMGVVGTYGVGSSVVETPPPDKL